jgi:hypothetical protein
VAEFKAKIHIEVSRTSFDKQSGVNLVRLGFPECNLAVIWRMHKQGETKAPPRAISSHTSAKFARKKFINVFKGSKLHMDVLRHHVGSHVKEDGIHASALKRNAWREDDENDEEADDEQEDEVEKADKDEQPMELKAVCC